MGHSSATRIAVRADAAISLISADNLVIVAPAGIAADSIVMTRGGLVGLFTHDEGVDWPNASGCVFANEYLHQGCPIYLQFETAADALACHKRMLAEAGR